MTRIIITKGVDGRWTYCPDTAVAVLRPHLLEGEFDTAHRALQYAMEDSSIPAGSTFIVKEKL